MKHKSTVSWFLTILFILLPVCYVIAFYIATAVFRPIWESHNMLLYTATSMGGTLLLLIFWTIIWLGHHMGRKDQTHSSFFTEIEEALSRISKGDFKVQIDVGKYFDSRFRNDHLVDLVGKVNIMAKELDGMETMREDFVSNVSHEIQSPLTSIRGFVSLLKDENLSHDERLDYIDVIESESQRLSKLSENLLRLSTLDSEYAACRPKYFSLSKQLKNTILLLEPQWSGKDIEISFVDEAVDIFADEELLSQVWINLLNNSIKFTPSGGKISVSVTGGDAQIQVGVTDSGFGMTKETMTHIFERFYMADKARSRSAGGSGLGLSIVKKIIQMHSGHIDVDSKPGEGTTFTVTLPKKTAPV